MLAVIIDGVVHDATIVPYYQVPLLPEELACSFPRVDHPDFCCPLHLRRLMLYAPSRNSRMSVAGSKVMTLLPRFFLTSRRFLESVLLCLCLLIPLEAAWATKEIAFTFENTDIQTVIKKVGEFTGATFLFDPEQVKGKITLLSPKKVSPEEALKLLQSALALHGYTLLKKAESLWIVPAAQAAQTATTIEVVPLNYARADEVAYTLSWIAPPGVQVIPYSPTNSIIISGNPEAVEQLLGILRRKEKKAEGQ